MGCATNKILLGMCDEIVRHVDEEAQVLLTDYRDGRARRKVMDSKGIYKRSILNLNINPSLTAQVRDRVDRAGGLGSRDP